MARIPFRRTGQPVEVVTSADNGTVAVMEDELEPNDGDDSGVGTVQESDSGDSPDTVDGVGDFEPVGDVIRTQPIADSQPGVGSAAGFSDPASATGRKPRKPRGPNKPKEGNTQSTRVVSVQLEKVLFALHTMAAATLSEPDLSIDEDEAKILAEAIEKVANAYNFSAMFSPKTQAGVDLCIALVTVYGARVMKIARRPRRTQRNVTPIDKVGVQS